MTGLEKVTGKIIADAEADARELMAGAEAECAAIRARYEEASEAELERMQEASDRECQALIVRAKSSAAMAKRNALLAARAEVLDEVYAEAEKKIRSMNPEQYLDILLKMLRSSFKRQLEGEEESLRLYGEDISPESYEILLNVHDRELYGERLLEEFRGGLGAKCPPAALAKLRIAQDTAPIDGGLILRCGPVETNCSLAMLLAETRRATEVKVSRLLFGDAT